MTNDEEIIRVFRETVKEVNNVELGALTNQTEISGLGLDSVATMEVIGAMEEKLDIRFPDEDLATLKRVGDLTAMVRRLS